ncbi:MAG: hydroxyacylglutathione hydrolase [Pelagibacteraceae bacterium]|nr:hydroxyacylglutathione hydrolase [Pelagibacteraceae bacterium]|tara:strand:- start:8758 stop:9522 length:765 start_codon:yes stop_codon:yes gene_type:complete
MNKLKIKVVNQLKDNYSYIIYKTDNSFATIVDPAESQSHINVLKQKNLILEKILITHHHDDHISGIDGLIKIFPNTKIYSPNKLHSFSSKLIKEGNIIRTSINEFVVLETPGHTLDHIILYDSKNKILFSGDTLFRLGCGRVFEGTYDQMYYSLKKINSLDDNTTVYCGHEYTITNLNFLESLLNDNDDLISLRRKIESEIKQLKRSIPFNLGSEKQINPFLNQNSDLAIQLKEKHKFSNIELFTFLRDQKNQF